MAAKTGAPIAFLSFSLLLILTPFGHYDLAESIIGVTNYLLTLSALMVLAALIINFIDKPKQKS